MTVETKEKRPPSTPRKEKQTAPLTVGREELLVDGSDYQFREMVNNALAFATRLLSVRDHYGSLIGLPGVQYSILITIAHLREQREIGITDLAEHLHFSSTFITTEVKKLANRGLVEKRGHKDDRRRVVLRLTPDGRALLNELSSVQCRVNDEHFSPLSRKDFLSLNRMMHELAASTDRALIVLGHLSALRS